MIDYLYILKFTIVVQSIQRKIYTLGCTPYTVQCTVYTLHSTLRTLHITPYKEKYMHST